MDAATAAPPAERDAARRSRRRALAGARTGHILAAARRVLDREGLDGTSLRAIAVEAGYTPAALYFHFPSREAIYLALLERSLDEVGAELAEATAGAAGAARRVEAGIAALFDFYGRRPADLDLALYLLRGGMKPAGLPPAEEDRVTARLAAALSPLGEAAAALGGKPKRAGLLPAEAFAHVAGLLVLARGGRLRPVDASARRAAERYAGEKLTRLGG